VNIFFSTFANFKCAPGGTCTPGWESLVYDMGKDVDCEYTSA